MQHTSLFHSLAKAFQIPLSAASIVRPTLPSTRGAVPVAPQHRQISPFSSTSWLGRKGRRPGVQIDRRSNMIRYALHHPVEHIPRPLRLSRLRNLRHWTIHRAWQLWLRKQRTQHELELERQWESMRAACEELRVGLGDGGRLYRQAMSKKGIWGGRSDLGEGGVRPGFESGDSGRVEKGREGGIPIEYARGLVDAPSRDGWDHAWTRA